MQESRSTRWRKADHCCLQKQQCKTLKTRPPALGEGLRCGMDHELCMLMLWARHFDGMQWRSYFVDDRACYIILTPPLWWLDSTVPVALDCKLVSSEK